MLVVQDYQIIKAPWVPEPGCLGAMCEVALDVYAEAWHIVDMAWRKYEMV